MSSRAIKSGKKGELLARNYLEQEGLVFITANWSCKAGELDLIMDDPKENCRVIVEVKLRQPTSYGFGYETVAHQKQRKLIKATQWYQQKEGYWEDIRFDVISIIDEWGKEPQIEHIKHAFV